ncbi:MAG: hypothetical protein Q9174_005224 [Haloplaca sp. 1 TL-2023]
MLTLDDILANMGSMEAIDSDDDTMTIFPDDRSDDNPVLGYLSFSLDRVSTPFDLSTAYTGDSIDAVAAKVRKYVKHYEVVMSNLKRYETKISETVATPELRNVVLKSTSEMIKKLEPMLGQLKTRLIEIEFMW